MDELKEQNQALREWLDAAKKERDIYKKQRDEYYSKLIAAQLQSRGN